MVKKTVTWRWAAGWMAIGFLLLIAVAILLSSIGGR